uniref:Uncharacterized protein n=1 Tax=Lactuca sativa TaxID=4236 RepID=A0A9R1WIV4_LACSA|nr:hypothetical protein LSAT_V11C100040000 [Lactuca sativa]
MGFRCYLNKLDVHGDVAKGLLLIKYLKDKLQYGILYHKAKALNQLTTNDLEGKFAMLESSSVDDDLASLKKELSGTTKFITLHYKIS